MNPGRSIICVMAITLFACGRDSSRDRFLSSGHIEATEVRVASKVPGRVSSVRAEEGTRVEKGAIVAEVDTTDLHLARLAAEADKRQALAELDLRRAGSRSEEVAEARATVAQADAELDAAERDLLRMKRLFDSGSGTEKQRDDAMTRRDLAVGKRDAARDRLERVQNGSRRQEIEASEARAQSADARLAQLRQQLSDATITAPVTGRVTERLIEPGEMVGVGAPLFVVTDLAAPWLTIYIDEPQLSRLHLGQQVEVISDSGEQRFGKVSFISSDAEFTPRNVQTRDERVKLVFKVKVALENQDELWKPGMPAEARLAAGGK